MKKIFGAWILAMMFCVLPSNAQVKLGVKGGLNFSDISLSGSLFDNFRSENRSGFFIGPMLDVNVPIIGIGVDAALLYNQLGVNLKEDNRSNTIKEKTLQIPINLKYTIGLGRMVGFYLAAGPQWGFNIDNKKTEDVLNEAIDGDFFKKSMISGNIGTGLKFMNHLQVGLNYNFPISKNGEVSDGTKSASVKVKTWQFSLAYIF